MPKIIFYFRTVLYSLVLLTVSFLAIGIGLLCTLFGKRLNTNYYVARTFYYTAGTVMGWTFEVEGEENLDKGLEGSKGGRSAVMVGNHQSFVDILYLGRIFPKHAAIMAKKSLSKIPGLGWFMLLSGTVFINRSNNKSAIASMQQAGEDMKRKRISLWIFPEGTRNLSPKLDLLDFKKGAFHLAVQSGAPIIPVVCENYHRLYDGKSTFRSGTLKIKVLPPIPTTGMTTADVPALMDKTRNQMLAALKEISQQSTSSEDSTTPLLSDQSNNYQTEDDSSETAAAAVTAIGEEVESKVSSASAALESAGTKPAKKGKKGKLVIA